MLTPQEELKANRTARLQRYGVSLSGVISYHLHGHGRLDQNCGIIIMLFIFSDLCSLSKYRFMLLNVLIKNTLHMRNEIRLRAYKEMNIRTNKDAKLQRICTDRRENFHCNMAHISSLVNNILIHTCAHRETITDKYAHKETNT